MAKVLMKILFRTSLIIFLLPDIYTEDNMCYESTPCLCKLSEDTYIDLSNIITKEEPYLTSTINNLTYYFFPCEDVKFNATQFSIKLSNSTSNDCEQGSSLCMYNSTSKTLVNLGSTKNVKFSNTYPKSLIYTITKPKSIISTISLLCIVPEVSKSYLTSNSQEDNLYAFTLFSSHVCIKSNRTDLSTGSTLLIIFSAIFGIYFVIGAAVLHFIRGARGKEMIPNLDFWLDLPCLVRDGLIFLLSGCKPISVPTAETYDRI